MELAATIGERYATWHRNEKAYQALIAAVDTWLASEPLLPVTRDAAGNRRANHLIAVPPGIQATRWSAGLIFASLLPRSSVARSIS